MNQKPLFLTVTLIALLTIGGAFWLASQRAIAPTIEPVVTDPVVESMQYPQHIEVISGNADEVWYNIPELGVRMKLNKEFAEDLIYSDDMTDDSGKDQRGIYFSTKAITEVAPECAPERGGAFGFFGKTDGSVDEAEKNYGMPGYYTSRQQAGLIVDFGEYFIMWNSPQATCWYLPHQDAVTRLMDKSYGEIGARRIFDGLKTLELIPKK